jgi:hypothetical protein
VRARVGVLVGVLLSACHPVAGNGNVASEGRDVSAFTGVSVDGPFTTNLSVGPRAVTVLADENLLALVETVVEEGTLQVRVKAGSSITSSTILHVGVVNEALAQVSAQGAAKVKGVIAPTTTFAGLAQGSSFVNLSGVSTDSVSVEADSQSTVSLAGTATNGQLTARTSSHLNLAALHLQTALIDIDASTLTAAVSSRLSGAATHGSTVAITGSPSGEPTNDQTSTITLTP